jgi:hypothetical protein
MAAVTANEMKKPKTECPHCHKMGMQVIGRTPVGKHAFKYVKMCVYCAERIEE